MSRRIVHIAGRRLSLGNLEKVLYPACGFTKAQVLDYYRRVAPFLLPHLRGRALTLKRFPDGVEGESFFEKRCPSHRPDWAGTAEVLQEDGERRTACVADDLATLVWVANLAALELHVPLARAASPETPDAVVFDLDPGEDADVLLCARVALLLRDLFARLGLEGLVKTSGQKGLHVFVPLNRPEATFEAARTFCRAVAVTLERACPELVTSKMAKSERRGRVFLNWEQNDGAKTMISAYSLRAGPEPRVSCPLPWEELERGAAAGDREGLRIGPAEAVARAEAGGDPFAGVLALRQALPHL